MQNILSRFWLTLFTFFAILGAARAADTTYVRINTVLGPIDVQLLSDEAPLTVENFLAYTDGGSYSNSIFHRAEQGFFSQGGSYYLLSNKSGNQIDPIPTWAAIANEFGASNVRGTMAMGLLGSNINSATSGFFINSADNSANFDPGKYTVFGRVANATSLAVMDALANLPVYDASSLFGAAFESMPLNNYISGTSLQVDNLTFLNSVVREAAPVDATITLSNLSTIDNSYPRQPTVTTNPPNLAVYLTYNNSPTPPTAVGSYTVNAYIAAPGYVGSTTGTLVVGSRAASPTTATISVNKVTATYDGNPHPVVATATPSGPRIDLLYNSSNLPPVTAGTYSVVAAIDDANVTGTAKSTVVINKAAAGAFTVGNVTVPYDGIPHRLTANTTPAGLGVAFTYNKSSTAPTNVGTYTVVGKISDPNYTSKASATGTLTITPITSATVSVVTQSLPYNGKPQSTTAATIPGGLALTYTYNGSATVPTAQGTYTVVATIKSPDYTGPTASGTGTLTITEGAATVTLGNTTAVVTGKPISVTVTTVPAKLKTTVTYNGSMTPPSAVGSYPVVATVVDANYAGSATGTLVITPVPPTATTSPATAITPTTATLNGSVNPKGTDTMVAFEYGTTTSYGSTTTSQDIGTVSASVAVTAPITLLNPGTTYHYRVVATSAGGTINGKDATFVTMAVPTIASSPATPLLSGSGAQVGFAVNPNGVATTVMVKYGTDSSNLNLSTPSQSIGKGKAVVNFSAFLVGLQTNTQYFYEVVAQTSAGTYTSTEESFTTLAFDTSLVAMTGTTANGTGGATYSSLGETSINNSDGVAFAATLTSGTGSPVVNTANNLGLWANQGSNTLQLIAQTGTLTTAPGTSGTYASFGDPLLNNNNAVAFGGQLKVVAGQATNATALGVWSTINGSLQLVAREGDDANGGSTFSNFTALALSDAKVIVVASVAPGVDGVTAANDFGIWEGTKESDLTRVLRTGDTIANTGKTISGFTLASSQLLLQGQTRDFASSTGNLAALASFTDKSSGIVTVIGGQQAVPYKVGDTAPANLGTFANFGDPIINNNNHVAFAASLTLGGGVTAANSSGIWAEDSGGALQKIARTGDQVLGSANLFLSLSDPLNNNNDVVAFAGTYKVGKTTVTGLYSTASGSIGLITQTGSQAPGCASGVTFSAFITMALPDAVGSDANGGFVFLGTVTGTGVTAANNTGIWILDSTGQLRLVVRTGDTVLPGKTINSLFFLPYSPVLDGQTRSVAKNSDLAFLAGFTDKSEAIFSVQFP